ncbi:MAG: aldolase/citrate lyase family protein [Planctomycetaceae bacterium]
MLTIKERLTRDGLILVMGVGRVMNATLYQIISMHGGFHALWFDQEHCGLTYEQLEIGTLAARAHGLDSFVRVAPTDYATVTRSMEAGASGIMAAQIFSAQQAEEIVRWAKFMPRGIRGLNNSGFDGRFGTIPLAEHCERANRDSFVAIQIETAQSVEQCDAIAAIDGVDMLFVGPADLSQSLGVTGEFFHPKCLAAVDRIAAACKKHGKHWGAVTVNPEHADLFISKGCKMVSPTNDARLINVGLQAVKDQYGMLFT